MVIQRFRYIQQPIIKQLHVHCITREGSPPQSLWGRAWQGVARITKFDTKQKQAFSEFEMEEEQNAS